VTRRDLIEGGLFLVGAAASAAMPAGAAPDSAQWWLKPVRLYHPNMRESELRGFDTGQFVENCAATNADGVVVNGGGIVAFYPSKVPYHFVSPLLNGRDFLKEATVQLHAAGMRSIARVDFSAGHADLFHDHPDWFVHNPDGSLRGGGNFFNACPNSPYRGEGFAFPVIREILKGYEVDGFHINSGGFPQHCYCVYCQKKYQARFGAKLPLKIDWKDPASKQLVAWRYESSAECLALLQKEMQAIRKNVFWTGELAGLDNPTWARERAFDIAGLSRCFSSLMSTIDNAKPDPDMRWVSGMTASYARSVGGRPSIINLKNSMRAAGWTHASMPPAEYAQCAWQAIAHGAGLKMATFGIPGNIEDDRNMAVIAETLGVLKKHAWVYEDVRPAAPVALVWSQPTLELYGQDDAKARYADGVLGFYAALMEMHIPTVVVSAEAITSGKLAGFQAVVLPNLACMSDAQAHSITEFVRGGGALIASHETSLYDADGNKRTKLALAEVLGAEYDPASTTTAARNGYLCRRQPHPMTAWMRQTSVLPFSGRINPVRLVGGAAAPLVYGYTARSVNPEEMENPIRTDVPLLIANTFSAGKAVYLPCDLDRFYFVSRVDDARRMLGSAVAWALAQGLPFTTSAPAEVGVALSEKPGFTFVHLVNAIGGRPQGEVVTVRDLEFHLRVGSKVKSVRTLRGGVALTFEARDGRIRFTVPVLGAYEVVAIESAGA
jgi:hypothetical protein